MPEQSMPQRRTERPRLWHPAREELDLERVLCALTDLHRRKVVLALLDEPEGAQHSYPWFNLPVSKAGRTHHFRILREAGLIRLDDLGNRVLVSLRRDDIEARFPGLLTALAAGSRPPEPRPGDDDPGGGGGADGDPAGARRTGQPSGRQRSPGGTRAADPDGV